MYASIWQGMRFAPHIIRRSRAIMVQKGLHSTRFMAAHWRRGDWFLGPHPRKLEQAVLATAPEFGRILRRHLSEQKLDHIFLMTNAPMGGEDFAMLEAELKGVHVVRAPVWQDDRLHLQQLCVEMAIATAADFFVAFGDGLDAGMVSMPSLLVMQMRLYAEGLPVQS